MLAAAVLVLLACAPAAHAAGPNVVLIMTDDQTVRDLQVMPHTRAAIGAQGVTFTDYRASYPLCCPARATMLTGQYAHNHHVLGNHKPQGSYARLDKRHTLPVALSAHDYVTAHLGKYLNGYELKPFRNIPPGWSNWHGLLRTYRMYGYVLNENGTAHTYGHLHQPTKRLYQTNVLRRIATRFIRGRAHKERPFYLSLAFLAPHAEIFDGVSHAVRPDPDDVGHFASKPLPRGPAFDEADISDKPPWLRDQLTHQLTAPQITAITRRFHARQESLLAVDRAVEAIVDTLRDTGQLRGTYVIFTSDNGFMEGQHRIQAGKLVAYEPATALPLMMRGPGIPAGACLARARDRHRPRADDPRHDQLAPQRLDDRRPLDAVVRAGAGAPPHLAPATDGDRPAGEPARRPRPGRRPPPPGRGAEGTALRRRGHHALSLHALRQRAGGAVRPGARPGPARQPDHRPPLPQDPQRAPPPAHAPADLHRR